VLVEINGRIRGFNNEKNTSVLDQLLEKAGSGRKLDEAKLADIPLDARKKPENRCSSLDTSDYITILILERNEMLRKKSNELIKTNVERKHKSRLIKEKSILVETEKEVAPPCLLLVFPHASIF
jgi:hypothetical protein